MFQKIVLGDLLERHTFETFQTPEPWQARAKQLAQDYAAAPNGWFVASGASGSGKTHLCTAICRRLLDDGRAVRYELWRETAQKIKAAALDGDARSKMMEPLKNAEVLLFGKVSIAPSILQRIELPKEKLEPEE